MPSAPNSTSSSPRNSASGGASAALRRCCESRNHRRRSRSCGIDPADRVIRGLSDAGIVRPVREAAAMAGRLAHGDLTVRIPERGIAEIGVLQHSFNTMAGSLQQSRRSLRPHVPDSLRPVTRPAARSNATCTTASNNGWCRWCWTCARSRPRCRPTIAGAACRHRRRPDWCPEDLRDLSARHPPRHPLRRRLESRPQGARPPLRRSGPARHRRPAAPTGARRSCRLLRRRRGAGQHRQARSSVNCTRQSSSA